MISDRFDAFIRNGVPHFDVTLQQMDRVTEAVFDRLDGQKRQRPRKLWWAVVILGTGEPGLIARYAVPMAAAAVLGILIGHPVPTAVNTARMVALMMPTSSVLAGL